MAHVSSFIDRPIKLGRLANLTVGTVAGNVGSFNQLQGEIGTLSSTRSAGSLTRGTFPINRLPPQVTNMERAGYLFGTARIGSFIADSGGQVTPLGPTFTRDGKLVIVQASYTFYLGTLGLRSGTNSRMGTQVIGSFPAQFTSCTITDRGHLWVVDSPTGYFQQLGTLGLRSGTNSRMGTQVIGSASTPTAGPQGIAFDGKGHLWHSESSAGYVYHYGTLGLRAGTPSRIGTTPIGSFNHSRGRRGLAVDNRGRLWSAGTGLYFQVIGTSGLRAGTNSRIGTRQFGSILGPDSSPTGVAIGPDGKLWHTDSDDGRLYRFGTTPATLHLPSQRADVSSGAIARYQSGSFGTTVVQRHYGRSGSFTGTVRTQLLRARFGSVGTVRAELLRGQAGSMAGSFRTKSLSVLRELRFAPGSSGNAYFSGRTDVGSPGLRFHYNRTQMLGVIDLVGSQFMFRATGTGGLGNTQFFLMRVKPTNMLIFNQFGSFVGSMRAKAVRSPFGSFTGTVRTQLLRAQFGSFGTTRSAYARGAYGSYGTQAGGAFRGHRFVGSVGSFTRVPGAGTLAGARSAGSLTRGTLAAPRFIVTLGTKLAGSLTANVAISRYAVWAIPFANANYAAWLHHGPTSGTFLSRQGLTTGISNRAAGSMFYLVKNPGAATVRLGSFQIFAIP